jgi:predicted  nucleic acid-binding Zn-ribbon protein
VAVARLVGNHCDGCHLTLPAMELDRIRHLPEDELVTCEQCGRILVHG